MKTMLDFIKSNDVQKNDLFVCPLGKTWQVVHGGASPRIRHHGRDSRGYYECEDMMSEHLSKTPLSK